MKRVTLYQDYKKLIIDEVRSYYKHRRDKLKMRRRFPYKFKTIEHYDSMKDQYWKKLIEVDDRLRKLYYYHHRARDNLIYRCELVGKKIFEKFKGNSDRLIYRSVTFENENSLSNESMSYTYDDKNYTGGHMYKIAKMTQQYQDDPNDKSENKIRKIVFSIEKNKVFIYYHYKEGQIFRKPDMINRRELLGTGTKDMNDKDQDKGEGSSRQQ